MQERLVVGGGRMRWTSAFVLVATLASVTWTPSAEAGFRPSGWNLVGSATRTDDGRAQLTPDTGGQTGGVWTRRRKDVVHPWKVTFRFQLLHAFEAGADGFAFVAQDVAPTVLGQGGAGLGYDGIDDSFAIEFDTFANTEAPAPVNNFTGRNDPDGMHVRLMSRLNNPNTSDHAQADKGGFTALPPTLNDRDVHSAKIVYKRKHLKVYVDGILCLDVGIPSLSQWIGDIPNDGKAYLGFTAATGGASQSHLIDGFRYERL